MERKVVNKSLVYLLFTILIAISVSALFGLSYSGKTILYSSSLNECNNLEGICRSSCSSNEHSIGVKDCAVSSVSRGSGSSGSGSSTDSEEAPDEESAGVFGGSGDFCGDESCNGDETCSSCPDDCGQCSSGGPGASPLIIKDTPEGEIGLAILDVTGLATSSPVCCVLNECYSNSDCPANKYCSYYECIPNKELEIEGLQQPDNNFIYYNVRQGQTVIYEDYKFQLTRLSYLLKRVSFTFNSETYTLSENLPAQIDLDGDNIYEIEVSLSRIEQDNSCVIIIKVLENNLDVQSSPAIIAPEGLQDPSYKSLANIFIFLIKTIT